MTPDEHIQQPATEQTEVVVVGAGPIGVEMAGVLQRQGTAYVLLDAGALGESITRWPRDTRFFSSSEWVAVAGIPIHTRDQGIVTGEEYLAYLRQVVEVLGLNLKTYERVDRIEREADRQFLLSTQTHSGVRYRYRSKYVVLATGDMNQPRRLGIPGEDLPHVTHYWNDPHAYFHKRLLIVGGKNSAVEAAIRCWRAGAQVAISYRGPSLEQKRLISRLYLEIDLLMQNGQIEFYGQSVPSRIEPGYVVLEPGARKVAADFVYLATGFTMDEQLYDQLNIERSGPDRVPAFDPATMETPTAGVYVVGTATGGNQRHYRVFITTSHEHCLRAARSMFPERSVSDGWVGNLQSRDYPLTSSDVE